VGTKPSIVVIKKKGGHGGGHHGGAWKVAYADFVTAMMSLFIVLWLMNSSKKIQEAVGGYFRDPSGTAEKVGSLNQGTGDNFVVTKDNMEQLKIQLQSAMRQLPNINAIKDHIEMTITPDGLRIELLESSNSTFFNSGNSEVTADGKEILILLAQELGSIPNRIAVEGHTDSKPYPAGSPYGNWELSVERANSARRLMQQHGIRDDQIMQIRGFADQRLRKPDAPLDPSNRRVSLIVEYLQKPDGSQDGTSESKGEAAPESPPSSGSAKEKP
jgi:chemotaxis protein MotB